MQAILAEYLGDHEGEAQQGRGSFIQGDVLLAAGPSALCRSGRRRSYAMQLIDTCTKDTTSLAI
jgi:hypothetical protein